MEIHCAGCGWRVGADRGNRAVLLCANEAAGADCVRDCPGALCCRNSRRLRRRQRIKRRWNHGDARRHVQDDGASDGAVSAARRDGNARRGVRRSFQQGHGMPCPNAALVQRSHRAGVCRVRFSYRRPLAGAFDFAFAGTTSKQNSKTPAGGQRYKGQHAASQRCTHSTGVLLPTSGTACRAPTAEKCNHEGSRRARANQNSKTPARRRRYERRGRRLQINYAAVVAVGFAAAAFYLFRADVALNQFFGGHLRGA